MALTGECVQIEPSSFEETMQQLIWVDAMVEEYDSIVRNSVWDVVPRLENKSRGLTMMRLLILSQDWAGSPSDQKSTTGGIFNLGSVTISWYSGKQRLVALSLAEAEYMDASQASSEAIWMQKILVGLFDQRMDPIVIYCDNQRCIKLSENPVFHDRSKHVDIRYHHLRDRVARRIMLLHYILIEEKYVDILTKALSKCKFEFHRDRMGVANNPFLIEREY
eukprot:PITA_29209